MNNSQAMEHRVTAAAPQNRVRSANSTVTGSLGKNADDSPWEGEILSIKEVTGYPVDAKIIGTRYIGPKRLKDSNRYIEQRFGWWVQPGKIVVVNRRRQVQPQPDGSFLPIGDWLTPKRTEYCFAGNGDARKADVPNDAVAVTISGSDGVQALWNNKKFADGLNNLKYLPAEVRQRFTSRIPNPTVLEAEATRWGGNSNSGYYKVVALTVNESRAMVIMASMQIGSEMWQVQMTEYLLEATLTANKPHLTLGKAA